MAADATDAEIIAVLISRLLRDGELAGTGAASEIPLAACLLARRLHAPRLTVVAGGIYVNPRVVPPSFAAGDDVPCEFVGDFHDVWALTEGGVDVMFYSGLQIDRWGGINLHRLGGRRPRRGPGLANTSFGHTAGRILLWCDRHERRRLVETLDFTSVVGQCWNGRPRSVLGLPNAGPTHLVTDRVVFANTPDEPFEPVSTHGSSWEAVRAETGWTLPDEPPPMTEPPTHEELAVLRDEVDVHATLRS